MLFIKDEAPAQQAVLHNVDNETATKHSKADRVLILCGYFITSYWVFTRSIIQRAKHLPVMYLGHIVCLPRKIFANAGYLIEAEE